MDRRRFTPSAEGLEGRALLSLFGTNTANRNLTVSIQNLPDTFKLKAQRIAHLPYYLKQFDTQRFLSPETMHQLQYDLYQVAGNLHAPTTKVVDNFNHELRVAYPDKTLSPRNAMLLNRSFGSVLSFAGATPQETASLQRDLNQMALVDSLGREPTSLASNDYALVLETALAIGKPIKTPDNPTLAVADGKTVNNNRLGLTHDHNPTLVGTYLVGAATLKGGASTSMQIIDNNSDILGTTVITTTTGVYKVKLTTTLPNGTYDLHARAADNTGHFSLPSPVFRLKITSKASAHKTALQGQNPQSAPFGV
jgi:hypothetical protein